MPRKQNGFGNPKSFSVKSFDSKLDKGKKIQGSGQYPSNREFGSTVTRSAVQQWNLESTWAMWRKGYEYARLNNWVDLNVKFFAFLFSGTTSRERANFICKRFPSLSNDTATRYVVKREIAPSYADPRYATITNVINDPNESEQSKKNFQNREIWVQVNDFLVQNRPNETRFDVIKRLTNERISNLRHGTEYTSKKHFDATVKTLLKSNGKPLVYTAMAHSHNTHLTIRIPRDDVLGTDYVQEARDGLFGLIGQVIRMTNMPVSMPKSGLTFVDHPKTVEVQMDMTRTNQDFWIANVQGQSPFEVFVDTAPVLILTGNNATFNMKETFTIMKDKYQQYFEGELIASTIDNETTEMANIYPPLYIQNVSDDGTDIVFETIPFEGQLWLYGSDPDPYIVLSDFSFASWHVAKDGRTLNDINVYPWEDETFLRGDGIYIANDYACNCQSFSKANVMSPEALYRRYSGAALSKNRQLKYPLPSALSLKDIEGLSNDGEAGVIISWATKNDKIRNKLCKHSIAGIFAEQEITRTLGDEEEGSVPGTGGVNVGPNKRFEVVEPNTYPVGLERDKAEDKIREQVRESDFSESGPRAEISPMDFAFSVLQLLNLMDTEVGSILQGEIAVVPVTPTTRTDDELIID